MGKKKKKRDKFKKIEADRNRGKVFCTVRVTCGGTCKELHFKKAGKVCSEAFMKTGDGEYGVRGERDRPEREFTGGRDGDFRRDRDTHFKERREVGEGEAPEGEMPEIEQV